MATILPFPISAVPNQPVAQFIRVGGAHKKLADIYAAGRLLASRFVLDASTARFQADFIRELKDAGAEIVLDTEIAELSSPLKFLGHARTSPWLKSDLRRPFSPPDFTDESIARLTDKIAAFAIQHGFSAVLSPSHFLGDRTFAGWLNIDIALCKSLRASLDRCGGQGIGVDYSVILSQVDLKDMAVRGDLASRLSDLPIENVWIRASGMDSTGGPLKTVRYLSALHQFHNVGLPIVADYLGGITGLAAVAFGSVSGIAHGIAERGRFDASDWHKEPEARDDSDVGFGPTTRVEIAGLGKAPTKKELELLASAPGGRRLCSCADKKCCPHGLDDMLRDPRSHAAFQATSGMRAMEEVSVPHREAFFLNGPMATVVRTAKEVAKLRLPKAEADRLEVEPEGLMRRYTAHSHLVDKLASTLENLHEKRGTESPRAKPIAMRGATASDSKEANK